MPKATFWIAETHGARGLGDIRGSKPESDWYRATSLKGSTPDYDVDRFKANVDPAQQFGALRHDRNSGWKIKSGIEVGGMVTLEASRQGATLQMFEGIRMEELNIRSDEFSAALNAVVKTESRRSNMVLPPSGMLRIGCRVWRASE